MQGAAASACKVAHTGLAGHGPLDGVSNRADGLKVCVRECGVIAHQQRWPLQHTRNSHSAAFPHCACCSFAREAQPPIKAELSRLQSKQAQHLQRRKAIIGKPVDAMLLLIQTEADSPCACVIRILQVSPEHTTSSTMRTLRCCPFT